MAFQKSNENQCLVQASKTLFRRNSCISAWKVSMFFLAKKSIIGKLKKKSIF